MNRLHKIRKIFAANYYLFELKRNQWEDPEKLRKIQLKRLKAIIKYAYHYVPYYHHLLRSSGIKPEDIRKQEDLSKIPPISKQNIFENYQDFVSNGLDISKLHFGFTSGSTGPTMKFYHDQLCSAFINAAGNYTFLECGTKLTDNFVTVWGRESQSITYNRNYVAFLGGLRNTTVPLFPFEKLIAVLRQIKPDVILTFPSVLITLGNYHVSDINPRLIFTQGEMVTPICRAIVKKTFNTELFETYGSVEFGHIAFECTEHCGLHIITDGVYVEFLDEYEEHVSPGEQGEIIVTGLWNRAMPLIRYKIGDLGVPKDEQCSCGRRWPLIKEIQGRTNDCLVLPSGKKVPAGWLYIERIIDKELKKNIFSISNYQIVQDRKDRIKIEFVKGKKFDPKMVDKIKNELEDYFVKIGEKLEIIMQPIKKIPRTRTGKKKDFISML